ncbi:MAG TPA: SemiSWEET transporter [Rhizomicrobium sp.]|nr:SemiSWEET transporter [Rhizomicrobium sp.]
MHLVGLIGTAAACCTTGAYIPQVVKTWRTRSAGDISPHMFAIMATGTALWLAYGIMVMDWPVIGANAISLALTGTILVLTLKHG